MESRELETRAALERRAPVLHQPVAREADTHRLLNGVPLPAVVLSVDRRVVMLNTAAHAMPNLFACFGMSYGRIVRFLANATEPFDRVFVRALNGIAASAVVTVESQRRQALWRISMGPIARDHAQHDAAVVMLVDPPAELHGTLAALQRLFGLTAAEARVLALLLDDCRPREIADELHLSITTVRSHLKALFAKTGTHRQSELVALAWSAA